MKKVVIQSEYDPEYQEEVEQIVLGSILMDKNVLSIIGADFKTKLFSTEANKCIADAMLRLSLRNVIPDLFLVVEDLKKAKQLELAGGITYLSGLTKNIGSTINIENHFRLLQQHYLARFINEVCNESQLEILNYKKDVFEVYNELQIKLEGGLSDLMKSEIESSADLQRQLITQAYEKQSSGGFSGVPTGLRRVDKLTNGWQPSDLIIIAARPGMGKTALALSMLIEPSVKQQIPTAIFSLEMAKLQLMSRINSINSGLNVSRVVKNQLSYDEITEMELRNRQMYDSKLYIDDTADLSIMEFKTKARKLVREKGVKLIVIDYLQLMKAGFRTDSREQEVSEISKALKQTAKELNIPIIALSQLSRSVEQRGGAKIPMLSDLRESGSIEQDADMVVFCYRPEYYGLNEYDWGNEGMISAQNLFVFIIAKHRNGSLGEIPLEFIGEQTLIRNHPNNSEWYNDYSELDDFGNTLPKSDENSQTHKHAIFRENLPENDDFNPPSIVGKNRPVNEEIENFFPDPKNIVGKDLPFKNYDDICNEPPF